MVGKVELIPTSEGNRITVKKNEKVIVGRGSSLGCNEKKISRHHAELLLKDDNTLWITPTHANPVFYRPSDGKIIQLAKDIERELKDGDYIGLLPSSFFFRVSFSIDVNNNNENNDSDLDSVFAWKKEEKLSPVHESSPDQWSLTPRHRRSTSNQDTSVFDFDDDIIVEPMPAPGRRMSFEKKTLVDVESNEASSRRPSLDKKTMMDVEPTEASCKHPSLEKKTMVNVEPTQAPSERTSLEKKITTDVEPTEAPCKRLSLKKKTITDVEPTQAPRERTSLEKKITTDIEPQSSISKSIPSISLRRVFLPSSSEEDQDDEPESDNTNDKPESDNTNDKPDSDNSNDKERKLPKWMTKTSPSPVIKHTTTTPKSSYSRSSSYTASTRAKRNLSFEGESNNGNINESSNMSDIQSAATTSETKAPGKLLSRIPATKSFDSDDDDNFDSVTPKSPPPPKKRRSGGKRRTACQFGASCYRKNPAHRAEQSHPGDSDHDDSKQSNDMDIDDDNNGDKPDCPFGKSCYRQNPQHKRDFKH